MKYFTNLLSLLLLLVIATGCEPEAPTPTKELMRGNWELVEAKGTEAGDTVDIKSKVAFPVTCMQLTSDQGMVGTIAPMFTYIVYGGSKWIEVSSKISAIFNYASLEFNTGEYFVEGGTPNHFTVEGKLQATAAIGGQGLVDILDIFGIGQGWLQQTVYHKFQNVNVSFSDNDNLMTWEFTSNTLGVYNYKDGNGNYVAWQGWPTTSFKKAKFTFRKRTQDVKDIVRAYL